MTLIHTVYREVFVPFFLPLSPYCQWANLRLGEIEVPNHSLKKTQLSERIQDGAKPFTSEEGRIFHWAKNNSVL